MLIFSHELPQIAYELFKNFSLPQHHSQFDNSSELFSLSRIGEFKNFFLLFASALALFQAFLYTENVFLFLFPKRSGFLFSSHFADISDCKS